VKYSIIIPVFNGSATLHECLKAATSQNDTILNVDYTVIVVDDGSTDNTMDIAGEFPVSIIKLDKNRGRIIARLSGAQAALTEKLLFVDSRVILSPDAIKQAESLQHYPAVMGSYLAREAKYCSFFDTIFFLIRRKYYGTHNFPQKEDLLFIKKNNFKRAPKGTTVLLINRLLFIELTPDRTDKTVNDDTFIFQGLVFDKNITLIRANKLQFKYIQRTDLKSFIPWLFERGIRFADFYLRPGGYFYPLFVTILTLLILTTILVSLFSLYNPKGLLYVFSMIFIVFMGTVIYLSESPKDLLIVSVTLPLIIFIFGLGILKFYLINTKAYLCRQNQTFN